MISIVTLSLYPNQVYLLCSFLYGQSLNMELPEQEREICNEGFERLYREMEKTVELKNQFLEEKKIIDIEILKYHSGIQSDYIDDIKLIIERINKRMQQDKE